MLFYSLMPLGPALAAEVSGIDLSLPLDPDTAEALAEALAAHLVLVFRGQSLSREQYRQAASAVPSAAATWLYGPDEPPADGPTPIASLRAVRDELPDDAQARLAAMPAPEMRTHMRDHVDWQSEPAFVYRHAWRRGDVVLIDDRATLHRAHVEEDGRLLWRIVVAE